MARRRRKTHNRKPDIRNLYRVNRDIQAPEVRLVGDNFDEVSELVGHKVDPGVFPTRVAQNWAQELGIDLVEISPKASPPVCKLIEFNKFIYERKRKEKEIKSKTVKTVVKEIRFGPNTDDHDFDFKIRHAREFLGQGNKVKVTMMFRGRQLAHVDIGRRVLDRVSETLGDIGKIEMHPKLEGRNMTMVIAPLSSK